MDKYYDKCEVHYTGTNELVTHYLRNHPPEGQPRRWGLFWPDFPGPELIDAIIGANLVAPAAPVLSSPTGGGSTCDTTPAFQWSTRSRVESHRIQVDNNGGFASTLIDTATWESRYRPDFVLPAGTCYWRAGGSLQQPEGAL